MDSYVNKPSPKRFDVDPDGNVLFVVSNSKKCYELLVSTKFMTVASLPFRAMFTRYFKEARDLESGPSGKLVRCELPGDNPDGMLLLCSILHYKYIQLFPEQQRASLVLKLAVVNDKYDCTRALWFATLKVLSEGLMTPSCKSRCQMLLASYLLDDAEHFFQFTKQIIFNDEGSVVRLLDMMPSLASTIALIVARRERLRLSITRYLIELVAASDPRLRDYGLFLRLARLIKRVPHDLSISDMLNILTPQRQGMNSTPLPLSVCIQEILDFGKGICLHCVRGRPHAQTPACHNDLGRRSLLEAIDEDSSEEEDEEA